MVYSDLKSYETLYYLLVLYVNPEDTYWQIALIISRTTLYLGLAEAVAKVNTV